MSDSLVGNVLIVQSGSTSPVANATLSGIISGALNYEEIEEIFGSVDGFCGILNDDLIDLAAQSQQVIRDLSFTPGVALGTFNWEERSKEELDELMAAFERHNIRYLFVIGDQDAQQIALEITRHAKTANYEMRVISLPNDGANQLPITDHSLGYGSVAKCIASTVRELTLYLSGIANHDCVNILEIPNNSPWLVPSALLLKSAQDAKAPQILLSAAEPFDETQFLEEIQNALKNNRCCNIVTPASLIDENGNYITNDSVSAAQKLGNLIRETMEVRVFTTSLGNLQLTAASKLSKTDVDEAFACGSKAVNFAMDGITGKMVTILRAEGNHYAAEFGVADLENIVGEKKTLPKHWFDENGTLNQNFGKYLYPLIVGSVSCPEENGLPKFAALKA